MTRSQADELSAPVVRAYLDAEDEILRMIAEQLAADGDLSDTSKWRIRQLARAGMIDKRAIEIIKSYMPVVSDETDELITAAAMSEIAYTDAAFQRAAADGIKGIAVEVPAEVTAFKVMKRFKKQAHHDLNLVNTVMGYETKKVYRKAVNEVYNAVHHDLGVGTASLISGQESLQSAVRSTIRRMSQTGIPGFVDAAGHEWSPEAYVTMDLRTTAANTARQAQFDRCDDYGVDLIEVSSHMGARPLCAPYQGRIYSRGGASGSTKDGAGVNKNSTRYTNSVAYGALAAAIADHAFAFGNYAFAGSNYGGKHAVAIGNNVRAERDYEWAIGKYNQSNPDTAFAYGDGSNNDPHNLMELKTDGTLLLNGKAVLVPEVITGYDATKTQTLKNINGALMWVDDT